MLHGYQNHVGWQHTNKFIILPKLNPKQQQRIYRKQVLDLQRRQEEETTKEFAEERQRKNKA